jgi:hypothetical protein
LHSLLGPSSPVHGRALCQLRGDPTDKRSESKSDPISKFSISILFVCSYPRLYVVTSKVVISIYTFSRVTPRVVAFCRNHVPDTQRALRREISNSLSINTSVVWYPLFPLWDLFCKHSLISEIHLFRFLPPSPYPCTVAGYGFARIFITLLCEKLKQQGWFSCRSHVAGW